MVAAAAIVTARGGMTSHAAVVARGMGRCCVVGAQALRIDLEGRKVRADAIELREGDWITVDGSEGRVLLGRVATVEPEPPEAFHRVMAWADQYRRLGVRTNADTPEDAARAREFGAEGIGLCRTEHMFFEPNRIQTVRKMLLARDAAARDQAIEALLPMQRSDFEAIFRVMDGLPVTIRLIDLPPRVPAHGRVRKLGPRRALGIEENELLTDRASPGGQLMLGHRGPARNVHHGHGDAGERSSKPPSPSRDGVSVHPEIMVPLVRRSANPRMAGRVRLVAREVLARRAGARYRIGTMIELPRAALTAGDRARGRLLPFGTNDLTQTARHLPRRCRYLPPTTSRPASSRRTRSTS